MKRLLIRIFPLLIGATAASTTTAENPYFFVDYATIYRTAMASALEKYPDLTPEQILADSNHLRFDCNTHRPWHQIDPLTLELPDQQHAGVHCFASVRFVIQEGSEGRSSIASHGESCDTSADAVRVKLFSNKSAQIRRYPRSVSSSSCDYYRQLSPVHTLIEEFEKAMEDNYWRQWQEQDR